MFGHSIFLNNRVSRYAGEFDVVPFCSQSFFVFVFERKISELKPKSALIVCSIEYDVYKILPLLSRLRRWLSDI